MNIVCRAINKFFVPYVNSMILIKTEANQFQIYTASGNGSQLSEVSEFNEFYHRAMQEETFFFVENLEEIDIPQEHKKFAYSFNKQSGWFVPIRNQQRQVIGLFAIFHSQYPSDRNFYVKMFQKN